MPLRVLIVDDELPTHEAFRIMLDWEKLGCEMPDSAMDGEEALKKMREKHYDIVLTDIRMPNMDGIALIRTLHSINTDARMMVITAYDYFSYAQEALRAGVEDYFLKPIDRHEVEARLEKLTADIQRERGDARDWAPSAQTGERESDQVAVYLDHCFRQDLNVRELGKMFHMNPAYLGQQFHKATGQTIKDYINRKRIDWIKRMVAEDKMPTQQVIQMAGYRNSGYFYRKFQEAEGVPFAQWRRQFRQSEGEDEL